MYTNFIKDSVSLEEIDIGFPISILTLLCIKLKSTNIVNVFFVF